MTKVDVFQSQGKTNKMASAEKQAWFMIKTTTLSPFGGDSVWVRNNQKFSIKKSAYDFERVRVRI